MRRFWIDGGLAISGTPDFADRAAKAHAARERPLCLCSSDGVPMYVAHAAGQHILKRMPGTGPQHDPGCDSYEPPYELSGLGHLDGGAIQENAEDGITSLRLDFSLTKTGGRAAPTPGEATEAGSVRTDGSKLSVRSLLHYLWDQAEFNRWRPAMAGRRNWAVVRKFLLEAAEGKTTKGKALSETLYIPEMFNSEREAEISERRSAFVNRVLRGATGKSRPLALLIGEVKEIEAARFGHRLVVKHAPRFPFMLAEDAHRRLTTRFATELALWNANSNVHLIAIATFGLDLAGIASIETIGLMVVTENWIPFETVEDLELLQALTQRRANFVKGLRYNLPSSQPLASVVLREPGSAAVAMYILPPDRDAAYREALEALIAESDITAWVWDAAEGSMPPLPG